MTEIKLTDCGHCHDCGTRMIENWCPSCSERPVYHDGETICPPVIESPCNHKWCLTCRHWRFIRNGAKDGWPGPNGECEKIDDDSQGKAMAWTCDCGSDECAESSLITMPKFGCVEWATKT